MRDTDGALCPGCRRHGERDHVRERRREPVPLPRGISLIVCSTTDATTTYRGSDAGDAPIEILIRRVTVRGLASALAVLPWLLLAYASAPLREPPPVRPGRWIFTLCFLIAGVVIVHGPLLEVLRRVRVRVSRDGITVEERPFGARKALAAHDVTQLFVLTADPTRSGRGAPLPTSISVIALTRDDARVPLVEGLETIEQARFLEQQIESALGLDDQPVAGEQVI
jgi:hypothetical protein